MDAAGSCAMSWRRNGHRRGKDATQEQREITEVNASCYCVGTPFLLECLKEIKPANAQGNTIYGYRWPAECERRKKWGAYIAEDARECMGVNDRAQLAQISEILRETDPRAAYA